MDKATIRAAIYARVSSDQQVQEHTIGSQVEALEGRVREDGLDVEDSLRFIDEGQSGAVLVRPALERLRDQAAAGLIDRLYVHSPDRLARKYAYQILLVEEFLTVTIFGDANIYIQRGKRRPTGFGANSRGSGAC